MVFFPCEMGTLVERVLRSSLLRPCTLRSERQSSPPIPQQHTSLLTQTYVPFFLLGQNWAAEVPCQVWGSMDTGCTVCIWPLPWLFWVIACDLAFVFFLIAINNDKEWSAFELPLSKREDSCHFSLHGWVIEKRKQVTPPPPPN